MAWDDTPPDLDWQKEPPKPEEIQAKPVSYAESLGRAAVNNFPLAPQAVAVLSPGDYSKNLEEWNQKAQESKAANPKTYGVGAVAGSLAPLAIPGVGEALEATPVTANAALGVANALSNEDLTKNFGENVKKAGLGAGIGGTLGGVGKALGKIGEASGVIGNRIEAQATANALDINPRALYKIATKENANPETVALNINKKVQELFPNFIEYTDTAGSKYQKLLTAHNQAGEAIGSVIESTDKNIKNLIPEIDDALGKLEKASEKYTGLQFEDSVQSKAILDDTRQMLRSLKEQGQLNFQNLSLLKQEVGQIYHNPNNVVRGVDQAYSILSDTIDNILERTSVSSPELKPLYNKSKEIFKFTSDLLPAMGRGVSRDIAGKAGSLTNAALGAGAFFHPLAAGAAYAGKTAAGLAAPELGTNVAYKAVNAIKNLPNISKVPLPPGQAINQALNDYLVNYFKKRK